MNSFFLYLNDQRQYSVGEDARNFVRNAAIKWREMSELQKQPFREKQSELSAEYREKNASYNALLSVEEKAEYLRQLRDKKSQRKKKTLKKMRKETGIPKRNANAFACYLKSCFASRDIHSVQEASEAMKELKQSWSLMFEYQRKPFEDEAALDKQRYDREMKEYVEKLKAEGRVEILPVKYRKQLESEERKRRKSGDA